MKSIFIRLLGCTCFVFVAGGVTASCITTGVATQSVWLSSGNNEIAHWDVNSTEIHQAKLGNGFNLGLKIEPASAEIYHAQLKKLHGKAIEELVKISIYDMSSAEPKLLTTTWGGANSKQGFGQNGGANRVEALGVSGIELWLRKAACIRVDDLVKLN